MSPRPFDVRFEHRPAGEPALGLGERSPRLSWHLSDAPEGWTQAAYEVEVTRTPWAGVTTSASHVVESGERVLVDWPGAPLESRERARVRVRVKGDEWGDWSEVGVVESGLTTLDWTARFISPRGIGAHRTPAPAVGTRFEVPGEVVAARLYLSAHGLAEVHLNGSRVGEDWFTPGWTSYSHRVRSFTYDVTDLVTAGTNTIDILLGNGWYRGRLGWEGKTCHYGERLAALAQVEVVTADGAALTLATDGSWRARATHILADDLYDGEVQDLRLPLVGDDAGPVEVLDDVLDTLVAPEGPAVRITQVVDAQRVWRSPAGKLLVDFGQNVVGFPRLTVRGHAPGAEVVVRQAEVLEHDELGTRPLRTAECTDRYVLAGAAEVVLQPHFTFHGFRYAEVEGVDELDASDIEAIVLGSALTRTGWFDSSHELVNQLHSNVVWGMRGNFLDVPTDCPQRDERLGWTGDIQVFSPTAAYLHDSVGFLSSWLRDVAAEQHPDGNVPVVVPNVLDVAMPAAAWGDAATIIPWNLYRATGDAEILRRQLGSMKGWVDKITSIATGDLWLGGFQFGDWLDPDAPPDQPGRAKADLDVVATACWYRCASTVAEAARVLGEEAVVDEYASLAVRIKAAFQRRFVTPDGLIHSDAPTVYAQAICWGLLNDDQFAYAGDRLADLARLAGFRVSTGFIGTPLITEALTLTGHHDTAIRLVEETGCPSWLYPVTMGATTIWERWDSMLPDGSINPGEMTSFNHYALGAVADWLHTRVAGLRMAEAGYRSLLIEPMPGGSFRHASTTHITPYGEASVAWRLVPGQGPADELVVDAVVPVGTTAIVRLPGVPEQVVGAGTHVFRAPWRSAPGAPTTIRGAMDDRDLWGQVRAAIRELSPIPSDVDMSAFLVKSLDAPVGALPLALTMGGHLPGTQPLRDRLEALLAPVATT